MLVYALTYVGKLRCIFELITSSTLSIDDFAIRLRAACSLSENREGDATPFDRQ